MEKTTIAIEGMHCASCAANVEKSLSKVPGITNCRVNLLAGKGFFDCNGQVSEKSIQDAVKRAGYTATSIKFENQENEHHTNHHEGHHHNHETAHLGNEPEHEHGFADEKELASWKWKAILAWLFTIPIVLLMLSERLFNLKILDDKLMIIAITFIAIPVIFIAGFSTIKGGIRGFFTFYFNMDSLISLGTLIAYFTGILSFVLPIQDYSGISAMIMAFYITGKFVEAKARGRAGTEIRKLLQLGAKNARVLRGKEEVEIPISEVQVGDIIVIKPGEKIPTDGIVVKGSSAVDESMVTGESMPVDKIAGNLVIGATINQDGILYIKATKIGKDTFLAHIIKLVEEAQGEKIPIQKLADKITSIFVPIVFTISLLTFFGWWYFVRSPANALGIAISVLVIACPCALGLATPTVLLVGSGMGAQHGILIRKGEAIQTMKEVKTIVFDKTGTITKGKPEVRDIYSEVKENYLLEIAASIEKLSDHPIAKAIVQRANLKKYKEVSNFKNFRGRGLEGTINRKKILLGNRLFMEERAVSLKNFDSQIAQFEKMGKTTMIVAESNKAIGIISVADAVKPDSVMTISNLKEKGYRIILITGDNEQTAKAIASQVGIAEVIANVLPEEKAQKIVELQKEGMVAFVGDGINDAPALKQSNVGIAIGTGTDIAIEAGDIVLAKGSLEGVSQAINLSKATFSKIKQNLFWAFAYNTIAIPLAIAGFLHPLIAEIAMALSSITVVTNANLLRLRKI